MSQVLVFELPLQDIHLDLEVGKFILQPLTLNTQRLSFLFTNLYFLLQQDAPLDGNIILGFEIIQRRGCVAGLAGIIIVGDFDIAQLQLQRPVRIP